MNARHRLVILGTAALAGCSSVNPPLLFGDESTFGLRLGNDTAAAGMSATVGYKQHSIAVVPVTVLKEDGAAYAIKAHSGNDKDALSVFAVFDGGAKADDAKTGTQTVKMGQLFSTGLAAQALTYGYQCLYRNDTACAPPPAPTRAVAVASLPAPAAPVSAATTRVPPVVDPADRPYQRPLIYLRSDVVGFDIGGSAAEQGAQFTFGYSGRNIAMIPVASLGAGGKVGGLSGQESADDKTSDTYSVFGQFRASTETARLGFGLERFFATGIAARNLAEGVQDLIAKGESKTAPTAAVPAGPVHTAAKN
jgi:hypothetical protein